MSNSNGEIFRLVMGEEGDGYMTDQQAKKMMEELFEAMKVNIADHRRQFTREDATGWLEEE